MRKNFLKIVAIIGSATLLFPILLYLFQFGFSLSKDREIWSQFGSYVSGIYGPFLSLLTLYLLYEQNRAQLKINNYQREHNDANQLRADAEFHLKIVNEILSEKNLSKPESIKSALNYFGRNDNLNSEEIYTENRQNSANYITTHSPRLFHAWFGYCASLKGLKTYIDSSFEHHYTSVKKLPISLLG